MNKKTKIKKLINKNKPDKINQILDLAKKHGSVRVKNKNESFILITAEEYENLMQEKEELQKSVNSLLGSLDAAQLPDPKNTAKSVKLIESAIERTLKG
jgi:PHD/YefM family antitoxin component YafN of YafNO toxin-antitoxin module